VSSIVGRSDNDRGRKAYSASVIFFNLVTYVIDVLSIRWDRESGLLEVDIGVAS
jgi:hypothetical protein